jgi:hypothetical protein
MKQFKTWILGFGLVAYASQASSAIFEYEARGSWSDLQACQQAAESVALALSGFVNVASSRCEAQVGKVRVLVTYVSERPLAVVSTVKSEWRYPENWGGYPSQSVCEQNLNREKELFEQSTGLTPFISNCFDETGDRPWHGKIPMPWNVQIDAIGPVADGMLTPTETTAQIVGRLVGDVEQFKSNVEEAFRQRGAQLGLIAVRFAQASTTEVKVRVYSQAGLETRLASLSFAAYKDERICLENVERLNHTALSSHAGYLSAVCVMGFVVGDYSMRVVGLDSLGFIRPTKIGVSFDSYASCEVERPHAIRQLESALGHEVRASFCGQPPGSPGPDRQRFYVYAVE